MPSNANIAIAATLTIFIGGGARAITQQAYSPTLGPTPSALERQEAVAIGQVLDSMEENVQVLSGIISTMIRGYPDALDSILEAGRSAHS